MLIFHPIIGPTDENYFINNNFEIKEEFNMINEVTLYYAKSLFDNQCFSIKRRQYQFDSLSEYNEELSFLQ